MNKTGKYGSVLKKLLCFTNTKFMVFSKIVGYDISYISKWCNNIKIPTFKNIGVINKKASKFFSEEIVKQNKVEEFYELFQILEHKKVNDLKTSDSLKKDIYELLENAYKKSEVNLSEKSEKKDMDNKVIIGKNKVYKFIRNIITETIENSTSDLELLSTIDICKGTCNINLDTIGEYKVHDIKISAKVGFDMDEFEENPNFYLWRIYFILNKKWNMDFEFFDNKNMDKLNIISIRDKFAIIVSLDSDGLIDVATIISDIKTVNTIYDKAASKFKMGNVLIRSIKTSELDQGAYRTEFYSNDEFQFVSTRGFEFLLPCDIISDIINAGYTQGFGEDMSFLIRKLQITWEERFEKSKINFIILKSALMKYIEDGEIFYTDIKYNLTIEQRKNHVFKVLESMKKNKNIKITILDDELLNYDGDFFKVSVNVNNKKVFLKKNLKGNSNCPPAIYSITNEKLVNYINEFILYVKDKDFCVEYDVDGINLAIEKYGKMVLRMIEANEDNKKLE